MQAAQAFAVHVHVTKPLGNSAEIAGSGTDMVINDFSSALFNIKTLVCASCAHYVLNKQCLTSKCDVMSYVVCI